MKKVLIISTSIRNGSNSELLAKEFEKGAKESNNDVEFISLKNKNIGFCKGCLACQKIHKCVINDDSNEIVEKMRNSDVIVWASPIYYYGISGQMKTLIDRANSLYSSDYKFRDIYFLTVATENESYVPKKALTALSGWIDCFEKAKLKDYLFIGGLTEPNSIINNKLLDKAYNIGKNV